MAKKLRSDQVDLTDYYKKTQAAPAVHNHSATEVTSGTFNIARIPTGTSGTTVALGNHLHTGVYEPVFTKNNAFNKVFGTAVGTVAQGNDSRINNGQTAFGWGNHASAGYALNSALTAHIDKIDNPHEVTKSQVGLGNVDNTSDEDKPISTAQQTALDGKVDNSQVLTDVPVNAKFTDTVYTHPTTAGNKHIPTGGTSGQILRYSASGTAVWGSENNTTYTAGEGLTLTGTVFTPDFGTGAGKVVQGDDTRLSNARTPLAHNQAISTITGLQSALDSKQDTLTPGSNITITEGTISAVNTTYGVATTSANGLMSSTDKTKLNGIAKGANNYSLPTASSTTLGGVKIGSNISISSGVISVAAPYTHPSSHSISFITGLQTALDGKSASGHTHSWSQITSKPSTFAPSAHTLSSHSDVTITSISTGEILKWNGTAWINNTLAEAGISASSHSHSWSSITSKPTTFAPSSHSHSWSSITSKPSTFAPSAHTLGSHSDVTITSIASGEILKWNGTAWVNNTLSEAGISASSHSHSWSQITSKPTTFTPSTHSHSIAQVTDLQTALDGKASSTHSHSGVYEPAFTKNTAFNKNFGTTSSTVARGNDSRIVNGQTAYGWGNHASAGYALSSELANYVTLATTQTISGAKTFSKNLTASTSVTTPKVIFAAAGWSLEQSGTELQMKYNGTTKMRFLNGGSIVATQEITAYS